MPQISRSPLIAWLMTIFSGGVYSFFWVARVCSDINHAEGKPIFNLTNWLKTIIILFTVSIITMAIFIQRPRPDSLALVILIVNCLITLLFFLSIQLKIGSYIQKKQFEILKSKPYSHTVSIILLWLLVGTGVIYIQSSLNKIHHLENN